MKTLPFFIVIFLFIQFQSLYSQKENNIWQLSWKHSLNFNDTPPSLQFDNSNQLIAAGESSTVCDKSGNLLLSSDGEFIYNKDFKFLNFSRIKGSSSGIMSVLMLRLIGNRNQYYTFTLDESFGNSNPANVSIPSDLHYTIVDISLNDGNAGIIETQRNVFVRGNLTSKMVAAKGKCESIWLLVHEANSNKFLAFEINQDGIQDPVESEVGSVIIKNTRYEGMMKFSADFSKLVVYGGIPSTAELFDFDKETGIVSNPITLPIEANNHRTASGCFSPDGTKLYQIEVDTSNNFSEYYQLDITSSNLIDIQTSKYFIGRYEEIQHPDAQLGPNGIIYINNYERALSAILNPNQSGVACNYVDSIYSSMEGLLISAFVFDNPSIFPDTLEYNPLLLPQDTQLNLQLQVEGDSYLWQDGTTNPTYKVNQSGIYWVNIQKGNCTFTDTLVVLPDESIIDLGVDTMLCQGEQITLNATNTQGLDILWQDGSKEEDFLVTQSGIYWMESKDSLCSFRDSINISYQEQVLELPNDTIICFNENSLLLDTNLPNNEVRWQDGTVNNSFRVTTPGIYWAEIVNETCQERDSIIVELQAEESFLPNDTILCEASNFLINPNLQNDSIVWWTSGEAREEYLVDSSGTYIAFIHRNNCSWADTIVVDFIENTLVDLPNDTTLCWGDTLTFDYSNIEGLVRWQDGTTEPLYKISQNGNYWVELSQNNCLSRDSIAVFFESLNLDLGVDTTICEGSSLAVNLNIPNATYSWQDGVDYSNRNLLEEGLYVVQVATTACIGEDSIFVGVEPCETETPCQVYMPNAISPNLDGVNDYLEVYSNCELQDFNIQVFDRWGNRLFSSKDQLKFWDGSYKNQGLDNGVYLVLLNYRFPADSQLQRKVGTVTIFK